MGVVYFTSNASTGAGSLAEAIKNASPGDVIRPDESVFERGSIIEIALASTLTIDKNLTLDGGPYRLRLNGDGLARCCAIASGVSVEITSFDFIGGGWNSQTGADAGNANGGGIYVPSGSTVALTRCGFLGCRGTYGGGVHIAVDSIGTLSDCVIAGCYARGLAGGAFCNGAVKIYGSTIVGNAAPDADMLAESKSAGTVLFNCIVGKIKGKVETDTGSVCDIASSDIGFVESPPDNFSGESWSPNAWRNWDLRLLDDASPNPSPCRDTGDVDTMTQYDFQGNFRGRETNGVATCSPGAYETLQADLFWVGRDATGAEVVSPSWVNSDGWATSRFATESGDAAPQKDDVVFVDGDVSFDGCGLALTRFIVGGGAKIGFAASGTQTLNATYFDVGVGASLESTAGTQKLAVRNVSATSRFGDYAYIKTSFSSSSSVSLQIASTARFKDFANSQTIYRQGLFDNYRFNTRSTALVEGDVENVGALQINNASGGTFAARNDPRIVCRSISWYRQPAEDAAPSALTEGSTPLIIEASEIVRITGDVLSSDCRVDASRATPDGTLSLTLTGQTVYGDAPSSAVSLTGSATIDERGLVSQSLTLNADATLNVDGGLACVETLTVADGASVAFSSERGDAVLTATESATVGASTFSGAGYFASPHNSDLSSATFTEGAVSCDYGANVLYLDFNSTSITSGQLTWEKQNDVPDVLLEKIVGGSTVLINNRFPGTTYSTEVYVPTTFRVFDGKRFFSASAAPHGTAYELAEEQTVGYLKTIISIGYLN